MALKVKAVERLLKFDKESAGKYRYVTKACWDAAGEVIKAWGYGRPFETFHLIRKVRDFRHAQHRLRWWGHEAAVCVFMPNISSIQNYYVFLPPVNNLVKNVKDDENSDE